MNKFLITLACVLTGCAAPQETAWDKPGSSQQEFNMDQGQCHAQAFQVPGASAMQIALVYNSCMRGKGYSLVPKT